MEAGIFILFWVFIGFATLAFALSRSSDAGAEAKARPSSSRLTRFAIVAVAVGALVVLPIAVVSAAGDRVTGGAGTYSEQSSTSLREGRLIFRQTCASCHALEAAGAHGAFGVNLDTLGAVDKTRVTNAIKKGGASGANLMPTNLVQGDQAELVAAYVAAVAGAGRN